MVSRHLDYTGLVIPNSNSAKAVISNSGGEITDERCTIPESQLISNACNRPIKL